MSGIDLSAFENFDLGAVNNPTPVADGTPKQISLTDILEDPEQPRVEFPEDQMQKMAESIKERGVKTPISVKPHPTEQGKWLSIMELDVLELQSWQVKILFPLLLIMIMMILIR